MTTTPILDIDLGRGLPASVEVERSILGTILLDNSAYDQAAEHLRIEDFSLDSHRRIYRRMVDLAESSRPIDLILLVEELDRSRELEAIGGAGYVAGLVDGVPDRPSIAPYIRIVKEKGQLRGLIFAAQVAIAQALDGEKPSEIAGSLLQTVLDVEAQSQMNHALTGRDFMAEVLRELELQAQSGGLVGLPFGLGPLETVTGGLRKGEVVVIGALPGAGKTALACQIVAANAEAGNAVGVFSLEMSRWDLGKRFLSAVTAVSASKIRHPGHIKKDEWPIQARVPPRLPNGQYGSMTAAPSASRNCSRGLAYSLPA